MVIGTVFSIVVHAAALYCRGIYTPPEPLMEAGRTVVHLTLMPTVASPPEPEIPLPVKTKQALEPLADTDYKPVEAAEQDGSLAEEKGVVTEAQTAGVFKPAYPRISRRRGEEGTVVLNIHVLADGTADHVAVLHSSGFKRLDEAARKAALRSSYVPATRLSRKVDSEIKLSFTFRLTDD